MTRSAFLGPLVLLPSLVAAQLSGDYTVGPGGDFSNLTGALDTLTQLGLGDTTTFIVSPGGEPQWPLTIPIVPGSSASRPLHIICALADSSIMDIGMLTFDHASYVTVEGFTVSTVPNPDYGAVVFDHCSNVVLRRCRILEVGDPSYYYSSGLIEIDLPYAPPACSQRLERCSAISASRVVKTNGSLATTAFDGCVLQGVFDMQNSHRLFDDCLINSTSCYDVGNDHFIGCTFDSPNGYINLKGDLVDRCVFSCNAFELAVGELRSSKLKNAHMNFGTSTLIVGNDIDTLDLAFCYYAKMIGNRCHGPVSSNSDHMQYYNNSFDKGLRLTQGPGQVVRYNSFGPGAMMEANYISGDIEFNSIWDVNVFQPSITHLDRNNYAGNTNVDLYSITYDEHATFYDPGYIDTVGYWHATNALLTGKSATFGTYGHFDIDSVARSLPGDASANVICWRAMEMPDTLLVQCGDRIAPKVCSEQIGLQLSPLPVDGVIDEDVLSIGTGFYLFMTETSGTALDSSWVTYAPYPDQQTIQLYSYCGFPFEMNASVPWFADSMVWSPSVLFEDAHDPYQVFSSDSSVLLTSTVYTDQCGALQQFFQVNISSAPIAYFSQEQFTDSLAFFAHSDCCDSIRWDFDDGSYATEALVSHVYDTTGTYLVTLTCWLQGDSGVTFYYVDVATDGVREHAASPLTVFPNPSNGTFQLEGDAHLDPHARIEVYDLLGRCLLQRSVLLPTTIALPDARAGEYIMRVEYGGRITRLPLLIRTQ